MVIWSQLCDPVCVCVYGKLVWSYTILGHDESCEAATLDHSELSPGFVRGPHFICLVGPSLLYGSSQVLSDNARVSSGDVGKDLRPFGLM